MGKPVTNRLGQQYQ